MKYVVTILVVAALSLLVFVYRSEFEGYLPGWLLTQPGARRGLSQPPALLRVMVDDMAAEGGRGKAGP